MNHLSRFWMSTYSLSAEIASQNTQYIQDPKMDWTKDADLYKWFKDWREEAELLLNTVLSHIRNQETKLKFVSLWAGKEARTYLNMMDQDKKDSLKTVLDTLEDWTRPKSDEVAAFKQLRTLNHGNKTLSTYIQEVRRVVDLCSFNCVGDCKYRLIRNSIIVGLNSTKAYQQCISKGSSLTLNECIKICQTEDASCRQVQALYPESSGCTDSTLIHKIAQYPQQWGRYNFKAEEPSRVAGPTTEMVQEGPAPRVKTTSTDQNVRLQDRSVCTVGKSDTSQRCADWTQRTRTMTRLRSSI